MYVCMYVCCLNTNAMILLIYFDLIKRVILYKLTAKFQSPSEFDDSNIILDENICYSLTVYNQYSSKLLRLNEDWFSIDSITFHTLIVNQ